jgi:hypothetical protein
LDGTAPGATAGAEPGSEVAGIGSVEGPGGAGDDRAHPTAAEPRAAEPKGAEPKGAEPGAGADPEAAAWTAYLAATRQLDGVRRGAATAAGEQHRSVQAARGELADVRARLAVQEGRLRELGVPTLALSPAPPETAAAARGMAGGPSAVLAALRSADGWVEEAERVLAAPGWFRSGGWPARLRNLLVYGPFALVVPLIQVLLHLVVGGGPVTLAVVLVGLPMPAVAFLAGWWGVGRLFRAGRPGRLDRTPRFGVLVCLVPAVLATAGLVLAMLAG